MTFTDAVLERYIIALCLSVTSGGILSKRLIELSSFLAHSLPATYPTLRMSQANSGIYINKVTSPRNFDPDFGRRPLHVLSTQVDDLSSVISLSH